MSQKLLIIDGPDSGRAFSLEKGETLLIGRGQSSNTRIDDPRLSRVHCRLVVGHEGAVLFDDNSTSGTFIDGKRIRSRQLRSGDTIAAGDSKLRYIDESANSETSLAKGLKNPPPPKSGREQDIRSLTGKTLGHFKIGELAHSGTTSALFHAHDEKSDRDAVVKVMIPSTMSDDDQRSRFVRAVHAMIKVRHPNLVEVYGAGKQGVFCWCAMERIDGISVLEMIELIGSGGKLDWREVFRVGVQVARALECAHRHQVIHRNVTPENLMQRRNDRVVKLCDLMLAKALKGTQARQVTAPGQLVGNVAYMSPERMIDTSNLDWRSDQYGLGATLYALLTGHPPFEGKTLPELVRDVRSRKIRFSGDLFADVPTEFRLIVERMLEKDRTARFPFPGDLLRALAEVGREFDVDADVIFDR